VAYRDDVGEGAGNIGRAAVGVVVVDDVAVVAGTGELAVSAGPAVVGFAGVAVGAVGVVGVEPLAVAVGVVAAVAAWILEKEGLGDVGNRVNKKQGRQ
jgi:hypothetical protein